MAAPRVVPECLFHCFFLLRSWACPTLRSLFSSSSFVCLSLFVSGILPSPMPTFPPYQAGHTTASANLSGGSSVSRITCDQPLVEYGLARFGFRCFDRIMSGFPFLMCARVFAPPSYSHRPPFRASSSLYARELRASFFFSSVPFMVSSLLPDVAPRLVVWSVIGLTVQLFFFWPGRGGATALTVLV